MKQLICIAVLLFIASCSQVKPNQESSEGSGTLTKVITISIEDFDEEEIEFTQVSNKAFSEWVNVRGRIDVPPASRASVSSYFGGFIEVIDVLPGQQVEKGQMLFTLRNPVFIEMQQDYLESVQTLNFLEADFKRQQQLFNEQVISERDFTRSQSEYLMAKANNRATLQQLKMAYIDPQEVDKGNIVSCVAIRAPISGNVSQVWMNLGSFLHQEDVALEIINTDHIHLDLSVFEKDAIKIKEGQRIRYNVPEAKISEREGSVYLVGQTVTGEDRSVDVHGHVEGFHSDLMHGMYVDADIEISADTLMALSIESVLKVGTQYFVALVKRKMASDLEIQLLAIEVGKQNDELIQVINASQMKEVDILRWPTRFFNN